MEVSQNAGTPKSSKLDHLSIETHGDLKTHGDLGIPHIQELLNFERCSELGCPKAVPLAGDYGTCRSG